ncbi:MAG: nucleoside deaminase [Chlorobi bacterium]|nr:nucleoside deaminase [Chlorobiota bacterium]
MGHLCKRLSNGDDEQFMSVALELAHQAARKGEVPVGCVIVAGNVIVGASHNRTEEIRSAIAHAEVGAIADALRRRQTKWLDDCTLYVTLEPCPMCAGAIVLARISRVVFGAHDPKAGACETLYTLTADRRLNHRATVRGGVLADHAQTLLQEFFRTRRGKADDA